MNRSIALFPAVGAALITLAVSGARASDVVEAPALKAHAPQTAAARKWADLIARTERALGGYAAACASGEGRALRTVTTDDLHIEYTLGEPGTYLTVDGSNAPVSCAAMVGLASDKSNLWIFPTNSSVVFVQFDGPAAVGAPSQRQLALVEMRGERIARIVNFSAPAPVAPTTLVANE